MTAPRPCPACGGDARIVNREVYCKSEACLIGPLRATDAEAVAAWNRLASLPALVEALTECESFLSDGDYGEEPDLREVIVKARAALALAMGETT